MSTRKPRQTRTQPDREFPDNAEDDDYDADEDYGFPVVDMVDEQPRQSRRSRSKKNAAPE